MLTLGNTSDVALWNKIDQWSDKRTRGWFLVDSPTELASVILAYLVTVWFGPKLMAKRKPFQIKGLLIAYNALMVLLNVYIVKEIFIGASRLEYGYLCGPSRNDYHPEEKRILNAVWLFYISKCIEFGDTFFFILRKKSDQLSGLHIYHHCTMLTYAWTETKWYPSGASARLPMMNSCIHVIMYIYYGLSGMGPKVQKYLWWKKYLTSLQLVQFVLSLSWSLYSMKTGCNHHISLDTWNILYMCSFLYLFGKFYLRKYMNKVK